MKVYISGQITGLNIDEVKERFERAEVRLKDKGLIPINPLKNGLPLDSPWKDHMVRDIEILMDCQAILMLDNWPKSTGARIEKNIAEELGLIVFNEKIQEQTYFIESLKKAIQGATGMKIEDYATKRRFRDAFFARLIFTHHCAKKDRMSNDDIAEMLLKSNQDIRRYKNIFDNECSVNKYFRDMAEEVDNIIKKEI